MPVEPTKTLGEQTTVVKVPTEPKKALGEQTTVVKVPAEPTVVQADNKDFENRLENKQL